ncbi:MAG: glycosyltransferase [Saccharofermentanales bacterium]|jgi:glycosyltransferase involved in cell wall biosynthesis|nr:glycosyltransferase family 1 protein [Bacteroidales bacterium]
MRNNGNDNDKKNKLKVMHLVSSLARNSGVMHVIMNYYRNINRENIQFGFCYFVERKNTFQEEIESLGGDVFLISRPNLSLWFRKELNDFFEGLEASYRILHIHEVYLAFLFSPIAKKYNVVATLAHSHATKYSDKPMNAVRNWFLCRGINKKTDFQLSCSKAAGKFLYGDRHWDDGNVILINNALNCKKFQFSLDERQIIRKEFALEDRFVIGHIGRFIEQKNHVFFLEIAKELCNKQMSKFVFFLVGDGPLRKQFEEKVEALGFSELFVFAGNRKDIPALLSAMDVFVLPSLFEGLPVSCLEAQASGLPVVLSSEITKEVGIADYTYIDLRAGAKKWADSIMEINNKKNRESAYKVVLGRGYDITSEAKKLEALYWEILGKCQQLTVKGDK